MFEEKSRSLVTDFGYPGDGKYSTVGTNVLASQVPLHTGDTTKAAYIQYRSMPNATRQGSSVQGFEKLIGSKGEWGKYNKCYHIQYKPVCYPWGALFLNANPALAAYRRNFTRESLPALTVDMTTSSDVLRQIPMEQVKARAWGSMQPEFGSDFSLMNFILELKDYRSVVKAISQNGKFFDGLNDWYKLFKKVLYPTKTEHRLDLTIPAASLLLTHNLAISPLMKDVVKMAALFKQEVGKAQVAFQKAGAVVQTTHYSEVFTHSDTRVTPYGDYFWKTSGTWYRTKYTATMQYTYDYKMRPDFAAYCKYWGLTPTWETIWNALPFSFLVDYLVGIGKAFAMVERDEMVKLYERSYGESTKVIKTFGGHFTNHSRIHSLTFWKAETLEKCYDVPREKMNGILFSGYTASIYHRYPSTPYKGLIIPRIKGPSMMQSMNMLALARLLWR